MKQKFRELRLSKANRLRLDQINRIISQYKAKGYTLTLRQLYYQLVSQDVIPNKDSEYKKLGRLLVEGRMGGVVAWDAIEDRLRQVRKMAAWTSPREILDAAANQFRINKQKGQEVYVEVWVEKDALSQVVQRAANRWQVPVMVNRGYGSVTMMYDAYQRMYTAIRNGAKQCVVLYLGDHDPSGLDMVRDVQARVGEMLDYDHLGNLFHVRQIALTKKQIEDHDPPPNPAKLTDSRAGEYVEKHGYTSWEVDALPPEVLDELIKEEVGKLVNMRKWDLRQAIEDAHKQKLYNIIEEHYGDDEEE